MFIEHKEARYSYCKHHITAIHYRTSFSDRISTHTTVTAPNFGSDPFSYD